MHFLELTGILIGIYFIFLSAREKSSPIYFLSRAVLISAASWIAEESCILLYRFYDYHPGWLLYLDQVPLLIIVIWPVIIFSAMELTSHLCAVSNRKAMFAGAAIVATDALFIEPLSVNAGLWHWKLPGIFNVPPIGIMGWFFFALLCIYLLSDNRLKGPLTVYDLLLLVIPVVGTHLLLLLSWWGALRWVSSLLPPPAVVGVAWCVSFFMIGLIHKKRSGCWIKKRTLLLRIPAALFFLTLLIVKAADQLPLAAYALAFVPPYVMLMLQQYKSATDKIR